MERFCIFVSSPGDVKKERDILSKVVQEINQTHGVPLKYELTLWKYEENAWPSAERPQVAITPLTPPYQIFIGIMWRRFGTPTGKADSGTEEEYNKAYELWQKKEVSDIMFYFCKKPYQLETIEESEQVTKVLKFKSVMQGKSFLWEYSNAPDFREKIRKHLCLLMARKMDMINGSMKHQSSPDSETVKMLKAIWDKLTPELQNYLSVPYNENRMKGDGGIQTRDLFAAMVRSPSKELQSIMRHIPEDALPKPIEGKVTSVPYIKYENPWLSHCISSSIKRLTKALSPDKKITATDVFIDIARNGSGESVRLLREHDITSEKIEEILKTENLHVLRGHTDSRSRSNPS